MPEYFVNNKKITKFKAVKLKKCKVVTDINELKTKCCRF